MSAPTPPADGPTTRHTAAAFVVGLLLGTALVGPVVPRLVAALPSPASFDPVGVVLILGVLSIVAFVLGLATLYFAFVLVEMS